MWVAAWMLAPWLAPWPAMRGIEIGGSDMKKHGLGRGLSALLEEMGSAPPGRDAPPVASSAQVLPVAQISPAADQPRRTFDEGALRELADSIRIKGVLQPILVRPAGVDRYEIIAGERRWRASQLAGLHEIPVVVRELSDADSFEAALIENVQRADLNPLEEAHGYQRLMRDFGHTQEMVATLTGKARSHVGNLLRLLELPEDAQALLKMGLLSTGHAKAALSASDPGRLAREIAERGLTVRQAEEAARRSHDVPRERRPREPAVRDADVAALESRIAEVTGLHVAINARGGAGTVTLRYADLDQLDGLVGRLTGGAF